MRALVCERGHYAGVGGPSFSLLFVGLIMSDFEKMIAYIKSNSVLTLCVSNNGVPWAANCFYAFDDSSMELFILTKHDTRHGREMALDRRVVGTISSQQVSVAKIRGIQYEGVVRLAEGEEEAAARKKYNNKFKIAKLYTSPTWVISLNYVKYTDNSFGIGKKFHWRRAPDISKDEPVS